MSSRKSVLRRAKTNSQKWLYDLNFAASLNEIGKWLDRNNIWKYTKEI